jgi:hypothetical protein
MCMRQVPRYLERLAGGPVKEVGKTDQKLMGRVDSSRPSLSHPGSPVR